ncbi:MAG: acetylornithine deacetylase [Myxococcota bacterium]
MSRPIPEPVEMLRELVALPSVSSTDARLDQPNRPVIDRLAEWAEALGFRADVQPLPGDGRKANLVATLGEGDEAGLVLSGHSDTVPYDEGAWGADPFELTERGDRLVGLGAADMKGFFAAALAAVQQARGTELRRPLTLVATADEESGMAGGKALAGAGGLKAQAAVIGEPTSLRPVCAHKGIAMAALHLLGRSGHSSDPALGVSALEGMYDGMDEILRFRAEVQHRHRDDRFSVPVPTLNLGRIHGGDSPNRICPSCELSFDLRNPPGVDADHLLEELDDRLRARLDGSGLDIRLRALVDTIPAFETPRGAAIVRAAEEATGLEPVAVLFATEGPYFRALGIETVILGPGDIAVAHQPEEYVTRGDLERASGIYEQLIHRFCMEGAS